MPQSFFFFSSKHNRNLMTSGKTVHFFAEGRRLRSIYSTRAFQGILGNLGSYRDLASVSVHGPYMIFRGRIIVLSTCQQAATQLGLGRRAATSTPILAVFDEETVMGWFVCRRECQGWDFSPRCNPRRSLAWKALLYDPDLEAASHLANQLLSALLTIAFMWCKKWSNPELLILNQCSRSHRPLMGPSRKELLVIVVYPVLFSLSFIFCYCHTQVGNKRSAPRFGLSWVPHTEEEQQVKHQVPARQKKKQLKKKLEKKVANEFKWHLQIWVRSIFSEISRQQHCTTAASYMD